MESLSEKMPSKLKTQITIPEKLRSSNLGDVVHSTFTLLERMKKGDGKLEYRHSTGRVVKTLVRGLGSSNTQVQKNYFVALITLLKSVDGSFGISARDVLDAVGSELHVTGGVAKGEEGEILMGQVLSFGALVRSGALAAAAEEDQVSAVTQLLSAVNHRSYLPLVADPFFVDFLKQMDEKTFKKAMWPVVRQQVRPGPAQTLLMYHVLLVCEERFPSAVSVKFLQQTLGAPQVLSTAVISGLLTALKNDFKLKTLDHIVYSDIFKYLANTSDDLLQTFWQHVEEELLVDSSASNKQIMAIKFFSLIVSQLQNAPQVVNLLTPKVLSWFMNKHKTTESFQKVLKSARRSALEELKKFCIREKYSKALLDIIKKLLFNPGNILFEQQSGSKVIQQLIVHLKEKGVMKLAVKLRNVITGTSSAAEHRPSETSPRPWHNKERLYSVHLFCKVLALPAVQGNTSWRLEQLCFLCDIGFFSTTNIGVELAGHIRDSFFSCLNHKLPNLVDLRNILAGLVEHINRRVNNGDQLRIKVLPEVMPAWKKMFAVAKQIGEDEKHTQEPWVMSVFQTMFYHIGLHLFKEAAYATDVLKELHSVYERVGTTNASPVEPHWTEVVVEMFLSLLSRNSQIHRHLIGCIFTHFCPIMIPQNIYQIMQVLDPTSNTNPLLESLESDSESSSGEEVSSDDGDEPDDKESSDDGMSDDEEEIDEKANDKLRRAVFEALGDNGALTDVESVDLDDMDEEEAVRVDKALSAAFKAIKQAKTKKQSSHSKALTHFRLRVLDLVEVWLKSEPPLDQVVDTLLRLQALLEHSLVDRHQAPLEIRVRTVIKKLTSTRKFNVADCKSLHLGNILKGFLVKGNRTTTVYMGVAKELTASALFIARASHHVVETNSEGEAQLTVHSVFKEAVHNFFLQRDCLLGVPLFQSLFSLNVPFVCNLASKLPGYVFDTSVHPFRRSKALEFLTIFWKSNRLLGSDDQYSDAVRKMAKRLYKGSVSMLEQPVGRVQPKFLVLLKKALDIVYTRKWLSMQVDWPQLFKSLAAFQRTHVSKHVTKSKNEVNGNKGATADEDSGVDEEEEYGASESKEEEEGGASEPDEEPEVVVKEEPMDSSVGEEETVDLGNSEEVEEGSSRSEEELEENPEESSSESEEPPKKMLKKKSDKKRSHEKIKRTQLLKNNSKRLRLESMASGLEVDVFSKYKMLSNSAALLSPER